jgi:hypothetical protein
MSAGTTFGFEHHDIARHELSMGLFIGSPSLNTRAECAVIFQGSQAFFSPVFLHKADHCIKYYDYYYCNRVFRSPTIPEITAAAIRTIIMKSLN